MATPRHVLVFRFSALGDVAMTVPVIRLLLEQHPGLQVTFVSRSFHAPLFRDIPRLQFHSAHPEGEHKGLRGLYRLYNQLKKQHTFDAIADLHNVVRTKILRSFFSFSGMPEAVIDKGRKEKKELTRKGNKRLRQLPSTIERYAEVFNKLGLPVTPGSKLPPVPTPDLPRHNIAALKEQGYRLIGIAPFANHPEKMYPAEKMKEVIRLLSGEQNIKIFFLGGGKTETAQLDEWEKEFPGTTSLAGKTRFEEELAAIARLDLVISMDSANMHLASLFSVPVVSVWGATHPFAGFYGWGQSNNNIVQADLFCRPCSVFGNKPCYRGNLECMQLIQPETIYQRVKQVLNLSNP